MQEPSLSVDAEESMRTAGPLSDSIGASAVSHVDSDQKESVVGSAAEMAVPLHALPASPMTPKPPVLDLHSASHLVSEAAAARRRTLTSSVSFSAPAAAGSAHAARPYEGKHLVVLVHGYQGSSWDMRLLKNHLALLYPHLQVYSSNSNELLTEGGQQQKKK